MPLVWATVVAAAKSLLGMGKIPYRTSNAWGMIAAGTPGKYLTMLAGVPAFVSGVPGKIAPGTTLMYGGATAPSGYLICNGDLVPTGSYPALFAAIAYTFGGSGGNFKLPDMKDYYVRGFDKVGTNDPDYSGRTIGSTQTWKTAAPAGTAIQQVGAGSHAHTVDYANSAHTHDGLGDGTHKHSLGTMYNTHSHNHQLCGTALGYYNGGGIYWNYINCQSMTTGTTAHTHYHPIASETSHTHTFGASDATHSHGESDGTTMGAHTLSGGDSETRPESTVVYFIIKT